MRAGTAPTSPNPPASCAGAQPARQLKQGQRVAVRLGQDPVPDALIEPEPDHRPQQCAGLRVRQALHLQVRQPSQLLARLARGEDQPDWLGQQPPRRERQHLGRRRIQPLRVIEHAQQRPVLGYLRQQGQHRQPNQEPVGHASLPQPERDAQRIALRNR